MNEQRRKEVQNLMGQLVSIESQLETLRDSEQDAFDNMSEGLKDSEKGEQIEANISSLEDAICNCQACVSDLEAIP